MSKAEPIPQNEKTAQLIWTLIILSFFLIQAVIWTVAISMTASDPSHAIVDDYDDKAVHWDEAQAEKLASAALGWRFDLNIDSKSDIRGNRSVILKLFDRDNRPIDNAVVSVSAFHRGRAAEVQQRDLASRDDGSYDANFRIRHDGLWQFTGVATVGDRRFLIDERKSIRLQRQN